ncbi:MAG: ATP-binding cassette domain-containing protein [Gemmatimonadetes bacterium]|nr:ATP-binding cassette domain-containing protein [Gemmatimonadota bacterium]
MTPTPLALALVEELLPHLGGADVGTDWRSEERRAEHSASDAASLADEVADCGRRAGLSFLRRSFNAVEWPEAMRGAAVPMVLIADHPSAGVHAAIVDAVHPSELTMRSSNGGALGGSERLALIEAFTRMAGPDGIVAVLFPVPQVRAGDPAAPEALDGDGTGQRTRSASPLERLGALLLSEKGNIGLVYAYATLVGLFSLTLPLGVQAIIGLVSGGLLLQPVVLLIAFVVAGTLATGVLQVLQLAAVESIQQRVFARLALEFSIRVPRVNLEQAWREDLPERMNRFFEVVTIQKSLGKLLTGTTTALLQVVFGLLLLTFYHPYFTLFSLALVVTLAAILRVTGPRGLETSLMESTYKYRAVHWLEEVARAAHTFKSAGRATPALERMDGHVSGYLRSRQRHFRVLIIQAMAAIGFKVLVTGAMLVLGSMLVIDRQITLGQFVAAELVIVTVLAGIEKLVGSLAEVYDTLTSVYKLGHVTDLALERTDGLALAPSDQGVRLSLDRVSYRYPGAEQDALSGLSFTVAPGERLAVTGPDGSGESTLIDVLSAIRPGYSGTVQFDGITLRDLDPAALRDRVGLVFGTSELFEGTVEENISLGRRGVGSRDVLAALERVGASDAVQSLPLGLRTVITGDARVLPSSLRVRLLIARAIVARPRLLLVDDCLATIEPLARREIAAVLLDRRAPWTLVIVTHTRELLDAVDRVLVLERGRLVRQGPFASLAEDPGGAAPSSTAGGIV